MKKRCFRITLSAALVTLFGGTVIHAATGVRSLAESGAKGSAPRIAAGNFHTCQVNEDGTVRCWGDNSIGQLGDGTTTNRPFPAPVIGLNNAVAIAAGFAHTCALLATGAVSCWGNNSLFELGVGLLSDGTKRSLKPVTVSGLTNVTAITARAGASHTCALIADGTARCWGDNASGQLGDGTRNIRTTPVVVKANSVTALNNIMAVAAGGQHTCALLADSTARCWGANSSGQLGNFNDTAQLIPVAVSGLTNAVTITAGSSHTCALLGNGSAQCWGNNGSGQLGDQTTTNKFLPTTVFGISTAVALAGGSNYTCALLVDGTARCWGNNSFGKLGDSTRTSTSLAVAVRGLNNSVFLQAAVDHTCALVADGTAHCWGLNSSGQLGDGTLSNSLTPNIVPGAGSFTARSIAAGGSHTCAVRANGTVACWGLNSSGQLGDGTTTDRLTPVAVISGFGSDGSPIPLTNAVAVTAGEAHTCALLAGGSARCWGDNSKGQLGNGTTTGSLIPVATVSPIINSIVAAIAAGDNHTCARTANGSDFCWGDNSRGQLGDGSTANRLSPSSRTSS